MAERVGIPSRPNMVPLIRDDKWQDKNVSLKNLFKVFALVIIVGIPSNMGFVYAAEHLSTLGFLL